MIVNIAKALKVKNQTVRDMKRAHAEVSNNNGYREDRTPVDIKESWAKYLALQDKLAVIKSAIYTANSGISPRLHEQQKLRGMIGELESLLRGQEYVQTYNAAQDPVEVKVLYQISHEEIKKRISDALSRIDVLQDEIDTFNATTKIEIPD